MSITGVIFAGLLSGLIAGLIIAARFYSSWEVRRIYKEFRDQGFSPGKWKHLSELADHNFKLIPKPNCETLYSSTFIKPKKDSYTLHIPPSSEYFGITFIAKNTDILGYITNQDISEKNTSHITLKAGKEIKLATGSFLLDTDLCWIIARFGVDPELPIECITNLQKKLLLKKQI